MGQCQCLDASANTVVYGIPIVGKSENKIATDGSSGANTTTVGVGTSDNYVYFLLAGSFEDGKSKSQTGVGVQVKPTDEDEFKLEIFRED
jgi:hypothetical protein